MSWFEFNGVSSDKLGLIIRTPPFRPSWSENCEYTEIPGRAEKVLERTGTYDNQSMTIDCVVTDMTKIRDIYQVLQGSGSLVLSTAPDEKLNVTVNPLIPQGVAQDMAELPISFNCSPFAYKINDKEFTWSNENFGTDGTKYWLSMSLKTDATAYCEPQICLGGLVLGLGVPIRYRVSNRTGALYIVVPVGHAADKIVIDSAAKQVYREKTDGTLEVASDYQISGKFPVLEPKAYGDDGYNTSIYVSCREWIDGKEGTDRLNFSLNIKLKCNLRYL